MSWPRSMQLELLEMRVEATLIQQRTGNVDANHNIRTEARAWALLFSREYIDRTLIGVLMMVFQRASTLLSSSHVPYLIFQWLLEWSGINALLYYGPTLIQSIGLKGDTVTLVVSGGIGIVQFIAVFPAIIYIDRWGEWVDPS